MTNQQTYTKPKGSVAIWAFSIMLTIVLFALQTYGWFKSFPWDVAAIGLFCLIAVATMSIWLTKYHDEPGEPFTRASVGNKILLYILMAIGAVVLFSMGRSLTAARENVAVKKEAVAEKRRSLEKAYETAGPRAKLKIAQELAKLDESFVEDPYKKFQELEPAAIITMSLDLLGFAIACISMILFMIFRPTKKMIAAQNGIDPSLITTPEERARLRELRAMMDAQVDSPSSRGGEMPEGLRRPEVEKELDRRHPDVPKGSRTEIEGMSYEFDGKGWRARGANGNGAHPVAQNSHASARETPAKGNLSSPTKGRILPPVRPPFEKPLASLATTPETALKGTAPNYPDAGTSGAEGKTAPTPDLGAVAVREGNCWRVLGRLLPDLSDVRYTGKPKKTVIEVWTQEGQYLCQFGKRELERSDELPQDARFAKIEDKIEAAKVRQSEREFSA
jgi:hypothetical protein